MYAGKIQVSVLVQENPNFMMRLDELVESISKSWIPARMNNPWSLYSEGSSHWRFQISHKPPSDQSRHCRPAAPPALLACPERRLFHRTMVNTVPCREVIQAFSLVPGILFGTPAAESLLQPGDKHSRIPLNRVELVLECLYVRWRHHYH